MGTNWISTNCKEMKCRSTQRGKRHANCFHRLWFSWGLQRLTQLVSVTEGEVLLKRTWFYQRKVNIFKKTSKCILKKTWQERFLQPSWKAKVQKKPRLWPNYFFSELYFSFSPQKSFRFSLLLQVYLDITLSNLLIS